MCLLIHVFMYVLLCVCVCKDVVVTYRVFFFPYLTDKRRLDTLVSVC